MKNPVSDYIHFYIAKQLKKYNIKTVLDMGGKGRFANRGFKVINADIKYGIDATNLPFKDNLFDASISIATLEHVGDHNKHKEFLKEANRVAKKYSIHWIPIHKDVEKFLKELGHNHPCVIPDYDKICKELNLTYKFKEFTTIKEHLTFLATIKPKLNMPQLHEYIFNHGEEIYAIVLELRK